MPSTALLALAFGAVAASCGGGDGVDVSTDAGAASEELQQEAEEAAPLVEDRVEGLTDVRSLDDLSAELDEAREDAERQAEAVEEVRNIDALDEIEDAIDEIRKGAT